MNCRRCGKKLTLDQFAQPTRNSFGARPNPSFCDECLRAAAWPAQVAPNPELLLEITTLPWTNTELRGRTKSPWRASVPDGLRPKEETP